MTNKLVIFRVPALEEGVHQFVQVKLVGDQLDAEGQYFMIEDENDSYTKLSFAQLVIADEIEGGSTNARSITIVDSETEDPAVVHELTLDELRGIVQYVLGELDQGT